MQGQDVPLMAGGISLMKLSHVQQPMDVSASRLVSVEMKRIATI